jgi:exodeoxyribonuclease VII small subunit|tara:strand:+ start:420 stop:632 length:213 start_codon:yes stop_codon:yes gene_type:complete
MNKSDTTIQQKIDQLDALVAWFDGDDFQLEQASKKLQEAAKLAKSIEQDLNTVSNEVAQVKRSFASDSAE